MNTLLLQTENLTVGYGGRREKPHVIARGLDLALPAGSLVCLLGPNGVGKSTLLRTLAGLQRPLSGRVRLGSDDVHALPPRQLAKRLSVVLTERVDAGLLSAYALVALGRHPYTNWRGDFSRHDKEMVDKAIVAVGAEALAARPFNELSDGEKQKVMIARALAQEPDVMILDEPTAFLDLPRRVEIMMILRRLTQEQGKAVLLSTHDLDLALRSADVVWLMENGRIHTGAPEDLVIGGQLARAFANEGVHFDVMSGSFHVARHPLGEIDVIGDGVHAVWTARALERVGLRVHLGANGSTMRVQCQDDVWVLDGTGNGRQTFRSLADLTQSLKTSEITPQ